MPAEGRHCADHTVNVTITPSPSRSRTRIRPKSIHIQGDAVICILSDGQHAAGDRHLAEYGPDNDPPLLAWVTPVVAALTDVGPTRNARLIEQRPVLRAWICHRVVLNSRHRHRKGDHGIYRRHRS